MKKYLSVIPLVFLLSLVFGCRQGGEDGTEESTISHRLPMIDVHLHAQESIWSKTLVQHPDLDSGPRTQIKDIAELLPRTVEEMKKYNIILGVLFEENLDEVYRWKEYDARFLPGAMIREPNNADLERITND